MKQKIQLIEEQFNITKWCTDKAKLRQISNCEPTEPLGTTDLGKTLGVSWNDQSYMFLFEMKNMLGMPGNSNVTNQNNLRTSFIIYMN